MKLNLYILQNYVSQQENFLNLSKFCIENLTPCSMQGKNCKIILIRHYKSLEIHLQNESKNNEKCMADHVTFFRV